jgi:hypothetical protein
MWGADIAGRLGQEIHHNGAHSSHAFATHMRKLNLPKDKHRTAVAGFVSLMESRTDQELNRNINSFILLFSNANMSEAITGEISEKFLNRYFRERQKDLQPSVPEGKTSRNGFYAPEIVSHLANYYIANYPLWGQVTMPKHFHGKSNAYVESYFRTLKHNYHKGKRHYAPDFFMRIILLSKA